MVNFDGERYDPSRASHDRNRFEVPCVTRTRRYARGSESNARGTIRGHGLSCRNVELDWILTNCTATKKKEDYFDLRNLFRFVFDWFNSLVDCFAKGNRISFNAEKYWYKISYYKSKKLTMPVENRHRLLICVLRFIITKIYIRRFDP